MGKQWDGGYGAYIPGPVLDDAGLRPRSLILYAHIVQKANRVGFCYAGNKALLEDMTSVDPKTGAVSGITERTLQSMLAELRDRGHIHMDTGPYPPGEDNVARSGRRIFIGRCLEAPPDTLLEAPQGVKKISPLKKTSPRGEENFTPL